MNIRRTTTAVLCLVLAVGLAACAGEGEEVKPGAGGPSVAKLDKDTVVVGQTLFVIGNGFADGSKEQGRTQLRFVGDFAADDGSTVDVDFVVTPLYDGTLDDRFDVLRWSRFGPFENPFGGLNETGLFEGEIIARNVADDGTVKEGPRSRTFTLRVDPSIVIEEFEPVIADCGAPALRGLGGIPYDLKVRAVGFTPKTYRYTISDINGDEGFTQFEHAAGGPTDRLGVDDPLVLNPVPADKQFYVMTIRVEALDGNGNAVETVLPFSVHRPLEFHYDGALQVAEYLEPVPVTGCIPGSIGNRVQYSETTSESRQSSVSITVSQNWSRANGQTNSNTWQEGYTEGVTNTRSQTETASLSESESSSESYGVSYNSGSTNSVGYSSSDGENWGWNIVEGVTDEESLSRMEELSGKVGVNYAATVSAEGSIPGVAKVGGSTTVGGSAEVGARAGNTTGERRSVRNDRGYSGGGSHNEQQSFGSTTTESTSQNLSGTYALSATTTRGHSITDSEARSQSRTYNLGGSVAESEVVTTGMTEAEQQTWSESMTHSTLIGYSGVIPVGRFGVFYRQTIRHVRVAQVRTYNLCGVSELQGEMHFNEWTWAPDLAIGDECGATLPMSNLPERQCIVPPCQ
jgi:hypothetical protein